MKNLILVFALMLTIASCTRQASNQLASEEQTAKSTNKGKKKVVGEALSLVANDTILNTPEKLIVVNAFNISNPSVGVVAFDNPTLNSGDEWRWTGIQWGTKPSDTTFVLENGFTIWQTSWIAATGAPLNPYVNGNGQIVFTVPTGSHAIRVYHIVFGADGQEREYHSFVMDGFQF